MDAVAFALANLISADMDFSNLVNKMTSGLPSMSQCTARSIDGMVYIFGGNNGGGTTATTLYDPETNTVSAKANMSVRRFNAGSAVYGGKAHVMGGDSASGVTTANHDVYDPVTNSWASKQAVPRAGETCLERIADKLYCVSGSFCYEYDPIGNNFTSKANVPDATIICRSIEVNQKMHVIGGKDKNTSATYYPRNREFDPTTNVWALKAEIYGGRALNGLLRYKDLIISVGGVNNPDDSSISHCIEAYDLTANKWTPIGYSRDSLIGICIVDSGDGENFYVLSTTDKAVKALYAYSPTIKLKGLDNLVAWLATN